MSQSEQIQTHPGYYATLVEECEGKTTLATEEIERDLHRWAKKKKKHSARAFRYRKEKKMILFVLLL